MASETAIHQLDPPTVVDQAERGPTPWIAFSYGQEDS
jgi:hypothetical protein